MEKPSHIEGTVRDHGECMARAQTVLHSQPVEETFVNHFKGFSRVHRGLFDAGKTAAEVRKLRIDRRPNELVKNAGHGWRVGLGPYENGRELYDLVGVARGIFLLASGLEVDDDEILWVRPVVRRIVLVEKPRFDEQAPATMLLKALFESIAVASVVQAQVLAAFSGQLK
jgi:hypothetical protein